MCWKYKCWSCCQVSTVGNKCAITQWCYGTMVLVELRDYNDTFGNIGIYLNLFSVDSVVLSCACYIAFGWHSRLVVSECFRGSCSTVTQSCNKYLFHCNTEL